MFGARQRTSCIDDVPRPASSTSNYSGNIVDICPVGALLNRDFRFRGRVWFLSAAPLGVHRLLARLQHLRSTTWTQDTYRYRPRENEAVNKSWMCDQGRLSYKYLNHERVLSAREWAAAPTARSRSRASAAHRGAPPPRSAPHARGGQRWRCCSRRCASIEDLLAAATFAKEALGVAEVYVGGRAERLAGRLPDARGQEPEPQGAGARRAGARARRSPFEELAARGRGGQGEGGLGGRHRGARMRRPRPRSRAARGVRGAGLRTTAPSPRRRRVLLPASPHSEDDGTFVNFDGSGAALRAGLPPRGDVAAALGAGVGARRARWARRCRFATARDVFRELGPKLGAALGEFHWDSLPSTGRRPGLNPLAAGTVDGRLAGYRDRVPPETSEDSRRALARTT